MDWPIVWCCIVQTPLPCFNIFLKPSLTLTTIHSVDPSPFLHRFAHFFYPSIWTSWNVWDGRQPLLKSFLTPHFPLPLLQKNISDPNQEIKRHASGRQGQRSWWPRSGLQQMKLHWYKSRSKWSETWLMNYESILVLDLKWASISFAEETCHEHLRGGNQIQEI